VFVAKEARRRGAGRALLTAAHDAARARGFREVRLRTRVIFLEAIALYESDGYVRIGASDRVLASGDVVYRRALG
jgi:ribosomal protein S18 acetylase RimI-like enzyme